MPSSGTRLIVTNAPLNFLKHKVIKSHFGKFGSISSVAINSEKKNCIITFLKSEHAESAIRNGKFWRGTKLVIEFVSSEPQGQIFALDLDNDLESELNWFAEEDYEPVVSNFRGSLVRDDYDRPIIDQRRSRNSPKRNDDSTEFQKKKVILPIEENKEVFLKKADAKQQIKSTGNEDDPGSGENVLNKVAISISSRLALLEERDKLLRIRLNRNSTIKTANIIKGLCPDMCPEKERILREVRGIVATYESVDGTSTKMNHNKAVKDYARSSADQEEPLPHELRPEPVLSMTLDYLITQIMNKIDIGEEDNLGNWYDFCWYRLRSIRKDIIQQQLCDINTVEIVEKCARFHICCFDRLWGLSKRIFDDKINSETLMNCLQSLMHMYEDLRKQGITCPNEAEFRAYLILLKLNSGFLLSEYQQYSTLLQKSTQVKDAVLIHTAYSNNMYATYFSLMKKTTYLNCCLMQRFLAHLRTKALEIIVRAHCPPNKISRLPISLITQTLKFDSRQDSIRFCESFGLVLAEDSYNFIFSRNDFFFPESLFVINTPSSIVVHKRIPVPKAVVGINGPLPVYIPHEVHCSFNEDGTLKQGASDAADQEEKLYRDIVERKLIIKRGSLKFSGQETSKAKEDVLMVTPPVPLKTGVENISQEIEGDLLEDISDEESDYIHEGSPGRDDPCEHHSNKDSDSNELLSENHNEDSLMSDISSESCEAEFDGVDLSDCNLNAVSNINSTVDSVSPLIDFKFKKPDLNFYESSASSKEFATTSTKTSIVPPISPIIPPKSPITPSKSSIFPSKSPIFPPKSPTFPSKSPIFPLKSPIFPSKSPTFPLKLPIFPPKFPDFENNYEFKSSIIPPRFPSVTSKSPSLSPKILNVPAKPLIIPPKSPLGLPSSTISVPYKKRKMISPLKSPCNVDRLPSWQFEKFLPKRGKSGKSNQEKTCLTKLKRIRSSDKLKKESLRKFAIIWRKKVEKLKKISDKSFRDYLFYWGSSNENCFSQNSVRNRLSLKKKTGLVVLSILHSNVVDRLDPSIGRTGEVLSETLARSAMNLARKEGNVAQPYPVFWKLIFALPPSLKGNFTFPDKLKQWCKTALYSDQNSQLGNVKYRLSSLGVPVFISANVILGSEVFEEECSNISAAIVIRANGWETREETQQRCDQLISVVNSNFPLAILSLGEKFESCDQFRYQHRLSFFCESMWNDTDKLVQTLINLAQNTNFLCLKVDSLRAIISTNADKLFDFLHEDRYINDGLNEVLCEPNNIIHFYNELINKIENEILDCYEDNLYGTACEFEHDIKKSHLEVVQFPSHYKDLNFRKILKKHMRSACIPEIKWPFSDSKDLLITFKSYCHNIDCEGILSKLIRVINPPDSNDFEHPLSQHLELIPWLKIVEDLVKEIIKRDDFQFNVVYRHKKFVELFDSHWWLSTDTVKEALKRSCNIFY